jgi:hypothetical protein
MAALNNPFSAVAFGRKPERWTDEHIPTISNPEALAALKNLPVYSANASPNDDLPKDRPQYFIVERPNRDRFLIDTQGYNYCRYVARIPKELPTSGADLAGYAEGEDIADLIDLARTLRNIGGPSAVNLRASEILSRIEARAK